MKTEQVVKQAGVTEVVVRGTEAEPIIYAGKGFKPGQRVKIMIHQPRKALEKAIGVGALDINKFLIGKKDEIDALIKEWDEWFGYVYPAHTDKIPVSRDMLFMSNVWTAYGHEIPDDALVWDIDSLALLHIMDKLDMTGWSRKKQIEALTQLLYGGIKYTDGSIPGWRVEHVSTCLQACATELDKKKTTLKQFVIDTIMPDEDWWLTVEENPDVDPRMYRMDKALEHSGIDPATYKQDTPSLNFGTMWALVGNVMVSIRV